MMILFKQSSKEEKEAHDLLKTCPTPFDTYSKNTDLFHMLFRRRFVNYVRNS